MEELFFYIVFLTPGAIGSVAFGYVIHCVISLVQSLRKKAVHGSLYGAVRTFTFAIIAQIALAYGGEKATGYFPTARLADTIIYLLILFFLVALVARKFRTQGNVNAQDISAEPSLPLETLKFFLFISLLILFISSTVLFIDKLNWYPDESPMFFFASILFFVFMIIVNMSRKYSYKQIVLSYKPDSPAKRIGAILSSLSFLYVLYSFILWCDYGGTRETENLLYSMFLFFSCLSIVLGIPQRLLAWVKTGK